MVRDQKVVTVFGSGSAPEGSDECESAARLGQALAAHGLAVCNGGYGGTMLAAARAAHEADAHTIGVTLGSAGWGPANPFIRREISCTSLAERIMTLLEMGDGYVVLPGGTGTLAEIGLLLELLNKGMMKPAPVVFLGDHWQPLLSLLRGEGLFHGAPPYAASEGIEMLGRIAWASDPESAAAFLAANLGTGT
ncbi:MAG: LOG family protein [Candidatus Brocadiaceae bacterium]|jgi:hypothetical protein